MKALIRSAVFVKSPTLTWPSWSVKLPLMMYNYFNIILNWLFNEVSDQAAHRPPSITQSPFAQFWLIHKVRSTFNSQKSSWGWIEIPSMVQVGVTVTAASMAVSLLWFLLHFGSAQLCKSHCRLKKRHFHYCWSVCVLSSLPDGWSLVFILAVNDSSHAGSTANVVLATCKTHVPSSCV